MSCFLRKIHRWWWNVFKKSIGGIGTWWHVKKSSTKQYVVEVTTLTKWACYVHPQPTHALHRVFLLLGPNDAVMVSDRWTLLLDLDTVTGRVLAS